MTRRADLKPIDDAIIAVFEEGAKVAADLNTAHGHARPRYVYAASRQTIAEMPAVMEAALAFDFSITGSLARIFTWQGERAYIRELVTRRLRALQNAGRVRFEPKNCRWYLV